MCTLVLFKLLPFEKPWSVLPYFSGGQHYALEKNLCIVKHLRAFNAMQSFLNILLKMNLLSKPEGGIMFCLQ